jgi:DNA-binding winged helix-turn-helix (wHTH) protein
MSAGGQFEAQFMPERLNIYPSRDPRPVFGRERELELLSEEMRHTGPRVIHIHGISGIGKSTLISEFAVTWRSKKGTLLLLDGRKIEPTESGFQQELARWLRIGRPTLTSIFRVLSKRNKAVVIALDSYELLGLLDAWLRQVFLSRLRKNVRLILVSRFPPAPQWTETPEWRGSFRSLELGPLNDVAAFELLRSLGADETRAGAIATFARGHPLALVMAGAAATQLPSGPNRTPQRAISAIAQRFLAEVEEPPLREAVRAASVVRRVTRSLLRALMPSLHDDSLFDRLARLPFVESTHDGLMMHDAVREAIRTDLEAIDPPTCQRYRRTAWQQLNHEARSAPLGNLWRYSADLIYLINNPSIRDAFFPRDVAKYYVERAGAEEGTAILSIATKHDGQEAALIVEGWWKHLPTSFRVIRDSRGQVVGFYYLLDADDAAHGVVRNDPLVSAWARHLQHRPLVKGKTALFLRRWLSHQHGEGPSPIQAAAWLDIKRQYLERRPRLQRVYLALANVTPYAEAASGLDFQIMDEPEINIGDASYRSLSLDMGERSVDGWLTRLAAAELGTEQDGLLDERLRALVVHGRAAALTRKEFDVMHYLAARQGEAVARIELLNDVWGLKYDVGGNVVDTVIAALRKKLGDLAGAIQTVHGHGYLYRSPALDFGTEVKAPSPPRLPHKARLERVPSRSPRRQIS